MEKYAVIKIGSKQYTVREGDVLSVPHINGKPIVDVLLYSEEGVLELGTPVVKKASVQVEVTGESRGEKIRVARFKSKSRYRKVRGYRDELSVLKIKSISLKGGSAEKIDIPEETEVKVEVKKEKKVPVKKTVKKEEPKKGKVSKKAVKAKKGTK